MNHINKEIYIKTCFALMQEIIQNTSNKTYRLKDAARGGAWSVERGALLSHSWAAGKGTDAGSAAQVKQDAPQDISSAWISTIPNT